MQHISAARFQMDWSLAPGHRPGVWDSCPKEQVMSCFGLVGLFWSVWAHLKSKELLQLVSLLPIAVFIHHSPLHYVTPCCLWVFLMCREKCKQLWLASKVEECIHFVQVHNFCRRHSQYFWYKRHLEIVSLTSFLQHFHSSPSACQVLKDELFCWASKDRYMTHDYYFVLPNILYI